MHSPMQQPWFEARRRFKLSHAHIQMARELGMNPKKFGSLANENQEPWKVPLREFIAQCYFKSFGRSEPGHVRSLEQLIEADEVRRKRKQDRKAQNAIAQTGNHGVTDANTGSGAS
ncbi:MAG: hypothetical protein HY848_09365 [Betaproteobacteria bacterium]|nr:hypothetical protein [Betaproteobacteria bacterium]